METTFKLDTPIKMDGHNYDLVCVSASKHDNNMLVCTIHYAEETEFGLSMSVFGCQMQHYNICPMPRKNQKKIETFMNVIQLNEDNIVKDFVANDKAALASTMEILAAGAL